MSRRDRETLAEMLATCARLLIELTLVGLLESALITLEGMLIFPERATAIREFAQGSKLSTVARVMSVRQ